jgi:hypothetical protein
MNWLLFLAALIAAESGGDPTAVGDRHLSNRAYGVAQIRQPYLDDVNRIAGTAYTMDQVRRSTSLSRWCVVQYIKHYGARYTRLTGKPLTMDVAYRIHNGGPNGYKRRSTDAATRKFHQHRSRIERGNTP